MNAPLLRHNCRRRTLHERAAQQKSQLHEKEISMPALGQAFISALRYKWL